MAKDIEEEQYDAGVSYWQNNGEKIYGESVDVGELLSL
jgi:hypothetical protein